jgi:hypothetical protein
MQHFAKHSLKSVLLCVFSVLLFHNVFSQVTVSGGSYTENFDGTASGLPTGWTVRTGATATSLGTIQTFNTTASAWNNTTGAFKNSASADGLISSSAATDQNNSTDRAISSRQTGTFGDPGAAFVLQLANTTGLSNIQISFKIQSLDIASARAVNWIVDYGVGATPTSFTQISTGTLATGGSSFSNTTITLNNLIPAGNANNVWVRIVALTASTGSGSRPTVGIDDFTLTATTSIPSLSASPTSITNFGYAEGSGPSTATSYTLTGGNLSPASGDVTVTAPTNFEVSTNASGSFVDNLLVPYTSGSISTPIFVRLKSGLLTGTYGGTGTNVTNTLGALSANVTVRGTVSCGTTVNISTVRSAIPVQASSTGTVNVTIAGRITAIFGTSKIYVQDNTGGIAIFSSNIVTNNSLALGDSVRLTGTPVRFNGEAQINTISCFLKVSSGAVPTPIIFDSNNPPVGITVNDFMCANEGRLIKIISSNFSSSGTFGSNLNYGIILCNMQDATEVRIDANSTGLIGATIPNTVTQDITGVLGRFVVTSSGVNTTDKLQIFPRNLSDLSASATSCAGASSCGITTFTDSPTKLDIMNWNVEWLGHPSNGPSQSGTGDATQIANAQSVLNSVGADIYMLQEICQYNPTNPSDNTTSFGKLIEGLNNTFGLNTYSGECSSAFSTSFVDPNAQRVCIIYKNSVVTKVFSRPMFDGFTPATYPPTGTPSQFWASGRKPFMFMAKVNVNSQIDTVLLVGLHAKAGSALDDYARRKFDVKAMYDTLQAQYSTRKTIVIGDLNDDVDKSIATTACNQLVSSYAPFLYVNPNETAVSGTRPNPSWNPISKVLSDSYCASTVSFTDYIDHQIISNELTGSGFGFKYVAGSVASFRPIVPNLPIATSTYANTTSDHYATVARYEYIAPPVIMSVANGNWSSASTWSCNCVPTSSDNVVIDTPHTVTVDAASQAKSINLKGIINYLAPFVLTLGQ